MDYRDKFYIKTTVIEMIFIISYLFWYLSVILFSLLYLNKFVNFLQIEMFTKKFPYFKVKCR